MHNSVGTIVPVSPNLFFKVEKYCEFCASIRISYGFGRALKVQSGYGTELAAPASAARFAHSSISGAKSTIATVHMY